MLHPQTPPVYKHTLLWFWPTVFTSVMKHVKARTGCAALPKPFSTCQLVLVTRALRHPPEACLHQVWSSLCTPQLLHPSPSHLPLISFPLTLTHCDLDADNRTAPPFFTRRQLTCFQRWTTLFPHISLMSVLPFPLCSLCFFPCNTLSTT